MPAVGATLQTQNQSMKQKEVHTWCVFFCLVLQQVAYKLMPMIPKTFETC